MKKCSHSAHESLTELNITPMLDLAFVLLVIFIISTIPPVKKMDLTLPVASKHQKDPPHKAYYISVLADGNLYINRDDCKLAELGPRLLAYREADPDLNVIIRGDAKTKYRQIRAVLDICQQVNLVKVDLATEISQ
jgi:biopolymer transport protein ExbD